MKIAVVQQDHNPGKPEENRKKALLSAETALQNGADLVLFHEEMLAGYTPYAAEMAEPADGETTHQFQALLQKMHSDACIVYGLAERRNARFYISAPVVFADGVRAVYRKTHLYRNDTGPRDESRLYTPGDCFVTFQHCGMKIGLLICYDGDFTEPAEYYRKSGCSLILWMNNRDSRGPEDMVRFHAVRNSMAMAVSCCCGINEKGHPCRGGSNITGADGEVLCELWDREGILYAEIEPEKIRRLRKENYWIADRREDLYI